MLTKRGAVVVALVVGLVSITCYIVGSSWHWLTGSDAPAATIRNLGVVLASIIALPLAVWRSMVAHRQAEIQRRGLLNERYQRGADMLGDQALSVRLGGVYALERLADEHAGDYHIQVMSVFSAFVRYPPDENIGRGKNRRNLEPKGIREDVRAILDSWRRRGDDRVKTEAQVEYRLDLRGADLGGACLEGTALEAADMSHTDLSGANLKRAKLREAVFVDAKMSGAQLIKTDLTRARFDGADLNGANFEGAILANADLTGARGLTKAQLDAAKVTPESPDLTGLKDGSTEKALVWARDAGETE